MSKAPTLTDIRNLITAIQSAQVANHSEVQIRLEAVEEQVKLTNGRVKALETAEAVNKGVEAFKKDLEAQSGSNPKLDARLVWLVPLVLALASTLYWLGTKLG